jgi:hypothetical protein
MRAVCLFFYFAGEFFLKLKILSLYRFFMQISLDISFKYDLDVWKPVDSDDLDY